MKAFSVGFPGRVKSSCTARPYAQSSIARDCLLVVEAGADEYEANLYYWYAGSFVREWIDY